MLIQMQVGSTSYRNAKALSAIWSNVVSHKLANDLVVLQLRPTIIHESGCQTACRIGKFQRTLTVFRASLAVSSSLHQSGELSIKAIKRELLADLGTAPCGYPQMQRMGAVIDDEAWFVLPHVRLSAWMFWAIRFVSFFVSLQEFSGNLEIWTVLFFSLLGEREDSGGMGGWAGRGRGQGAQGGGAGLALLWSKK